MDAAVLHRIAAPRWRRTHVHRTRPFGLLRALPRPLLRVAQPFTGRGIAQQLVTACLANGSGLGYRSAVVEATNPTSQHILEKLRFTTRAEYSYAEYRLDGVPVFASIAGQGGPKAMIRDVPVARERTGTA